MNKTTLLLLSLSSITTVHGMEDESWEMVEAPFIEQKDPSRHLRSILMDPDTDQLRIGEDTFDTVIERMHSIPTPRHKALTTVFATDPACRLLLQVRAYDAEGACLPSRGREKNIRHYKPKQLFKSHGSQG